jgi:hypothetical protein
MKAQSGAINPTTEHVAQPRPVSLPPERQLQTTLDLEEAVGNATAMLDLLATKLAAEDRGGLNDHKEPPWVSVICILSADVRRRLNEQFEAHVAEIRRVQDLNLSTPDRS